MDPLLRPGDLQELAQIVGRLDVEDDPGEPAAVRGRHHEPVRGRRLHIEPNREIGTERLASRRRLQSEDRGRLLDRDLELAEHEGIGVLGSDQLVEPVEEQAVERLVRELDPNRADRPDTVEVDHDVERCARAEREQVAEALGADLERHVRQGDIIEEAIRCHALLSLTRRLPETGFAESQSETAPPFWMCKALTGVPSRVLSL